MSRQPNVVLCLCDQWRKFEAGCYGHPVVQTPYLDALATGGTRFEHAISPAPLCTPARSCTLTGREARSCIGEVRNADQNPALPERRVMTTPTLAECFRDAGYHTELIGKWHIEPTPRLLGFDRAWYPDFEHRYYRQRYWDQDDRASTVEPFTLEVEAERVEAFMAERAAADVPFFLYYNIGTPHQPIGPGHLPERYVRRYGRDDVQLRPNVFVNGEMAHSRWWYSVYRSAEFFWRDLRQEPQDPADLAPEDCDLRDLYALYYGAIACTDDLLGRMLTALADQGLAEDTIVVFASDHGDNLGSHHRFNKNSLLEEATRIPLVVRVPGAPAGVCEQSVSLIDVMPTLLELCELPVPEPVQGRSLAPSVRGDSQPAGDGVFIETGNRIAIHTGSHLLGLPRDAFQHGELPDVATGECFYDVAADPGQMRDLTGTGEQADLRRELRDRLVAWHHRTERHQR